jgi:Ca2+-binding RTX toxin-like protein
MGGSDILSGWGGMDTLDGGSGADTADYSDKTTAVVVTLNGVTNATVSVGGMAEDTIRNIENVTGGTAGDTLIGDGLANTLDGFTGADNLQGMGGNDTLTGGGGKDRLDGGAGLDKYVITLGASGITTATADEITHWLVADDAIDMTIVGSSTNYAEAATNATAIENAAADAESLFPSTAINHVFLFNSGTNTGYLLSDLDNNDAYETGLVITGAGSAAAMDFLDII